MQSDALKDLSEEKVRRVYAALAKEECFQEILLLASKDDRHREAFFKALTAWTKIFRRSDDPPPESLILPLRWYFAGELNPVPRQPCLPNVTIEYGATKVTIRK